MTGSMAVPLPHVSEGYVCPKCTGIGGVHYLTCPTLRLPAGYRFGPDQEAAS